MSTRPAIAALLLPMLIVIEPESAAGARQIGVGRAAELESFLDRLPSGSFDG